MASLGICGGNQLLNPRSRTYRFNRTDYRSRSLTIYSRGGRRGSRGVVSMAKSQLHLAPITKRETIDNETIGHDKIDEWMKDSVVEIVKNLREAPLLVQVYSKDDNGDTKLKTEKAVVDDWPIVTGKWKEGKTPMPEGVIFVEEIKDEKDLPVLDEGEEEEEEDDGGERITRAWGVVIQGKGVESGPACYLLKTSRVKSSIGLFCTHFCLVRVNSFRETALSQLTNCWLLQ